MSPQVNCYVAGSEIEKLFASFDIVVLSYAEKFGLVVAEALAHGMPIIASKGTPWQRLEEIGCGWWVAGRNGPTRPRLDAARIFLGSRGETDDGSL